MANLLINRTLKSIVNSKLIGALSSRARHLSSAATAEQPPSDGPSSLFTFFSDGKEDKSNRNTQDDSIFVKSPSSSSSKREAASSVTMPMSFMTGSIVGKRFYNQVTTRPADDGNGWTVMLDYRTLKTPSNRPLKLPTLALAKAVAVEWEYQETDGIRPFTMPLMKHAYTALERVPPTRPKTDKWKKWIVCLIG